MRGVHELHAVLIDAGLKVVGVALLSRVTKATRVEFAPATTDEERRQAADLVAAFTWDDPVPLTRKEAQVIVQSYSEDERQQRLTDLLCTALLTP